MTRTYSGIWPVAPTPFNLDGSIDLAGMRRVLDCMIDQRVDGICILANFSEQFLISDAERDILTKLCVEHVAGRVPVIVAISHFANQIVVQRAEYAKQLGADMLMMMAPYHGALMRGSAEQTFSQFSQVSAVGLPIMVQDAPLSGVELPVALLVKMARELEMVKLFKIECVGTAGKIAALLKEGGDAIEGPFDGEEAISLLADLDAGATGGMTSALIPELIKPIITQHLAGDKASAIATYTKVLPIINHENRQCGFRAAKAAMMAGGVIKSDYCREPIPALSKIARNGLMELLIPLDPIVLRWGK